jgi:predicted metal-dependent hydrolase
MGIFSMTDRVDWVPGADEGVRLFNERRFFEAHDAFEEIWMERQGDERLFYQALIQIAVAFYKIDMRNLGGARSQLRKGIDKLERTRRLGAPIDRHRLLDDTRRVLAELEGIDQAGIAAYDLSGLPRIHPVDPA